MARFAQYAMVASEEALGDAGWVPEKEEQREATVCPMSYGCEVRSAVLIVTKGRLYGEWDWESG